MNGEHTPEAQAMKTPAELLAELETAAADAKNSLLMPGSVRETVSKVHELASALVRENAEQAAQIEALQAASLGAHAELEARIAALESARA